MGVARTAVILIGGLVLGTGCFGPSKEAEERLAQTKRDAEELDGALASLEDRFLGNQYTVQLWSEMARRHGEVTQVACKNHSAHFAEMAEYLEKQTAKARMLKRRRTVASAKPVKAVVGSEGGIGGPTDE